MLIADRVMEAQKEQVHTLLVVDDDQASHLLLGAILRREGFRVISAQGAAEARELVTHVLPDLILMDIDMPGEDGLSACRNFKENSRTANIPVIFISALGDEITKLDGFEAGGVDYVTKPFYPLEVLARVRLHIRMSHAYDALANAHIAQVRSLNQSQQMLLPTPESLPNAHFAGFYQACHQAGGDFYDVLQAGEGIFDYMVADVSGHNLGTALPTAALKALVHQNRDMLYSPIESLRLLNTNLRPVLAEGQYVSLLYARLNRLQGKVTLINAGHPPGVLFSRQGSAQQLQQSGDPLGVFEVTTPHVLDIRVNPGDRLFLYTDGLIEQDMNGSISRRQGLANLLAACEQTRGLLIQEAVSTILRLVLPNQNNLRDDVVLLAIDI